MPQSIITTRYTLHCTGVAPSLSLPNDNYISTFNLSNSRKLLLFLLNSGRIDHLSLIHAHAHNAHANSAYMRNVPVMADLCDWNGGSGAAAAQQGDVSWLRGVPLIEKWYLVQEKICGYHVTVQLEPSMLLPTT